MCAVNFVTSPCTGNVMCVLNSGFHFSRKCSHRQGYHDLTCGRPLVVFAYIESNLSLEKNCHRLIFAVWFANAGWLEDGCSRYKRLQNQLIFYLSPLDIISSVVTRFLSPAIGNGSNWALCWQASTHGWAASTFHNKCDGKRHTITIIKKDQYVFGGYTDIPGSK